MKFQLNYNEISLPIVIGIDMTQEMVDKAIDNVSSAGYSNIEVRLGMIEDLPIDVLSFNMAEETVVIDDIKRFSADKNDVYPPVIFINNQTCK